MTVEVLLSCMHLNTDAKIMELVSRTNIKGNATIVSQCDKNDYSQIGDIKIIYTTERGLSRSRNKAIENATGDICLLCDDDEILEDDYEQSIIDAYTGNMNADLIAFEIKRTDKRPYSKKTMKIGFKQILQTSSVQITFKTRSVIENNINFDTLLGSGSGNGAGEENKFMFDLKNKHLNLLYVPKQIGCLLQNTTSQWFDGYTISYFEKHGWSCRRIMGSKLSIIYILYYIITKYSYYKRNVSMFKALRMELKGWHRL